jgi:hypothetical protein
VIDEVSAELNLVQEPIALASGIVNKMGETSLNNDISQFMAPFHGPLDESEDSAQ